MVRPNLLQILLTTINGSMIGYVTPLIFFTFLNFDHLQWVTGVWRGGGVKVGPKKQTLGVPFGCPVKIKNF